MGSFRLGGMTLGSLFKKPETLLYPFEKKDPYAGQKGHIMNEVDDCILCGMCQRVCPCSCITVDKAARLWEIDPFRCILCSSCVRACPKDCLAMEGTATGIVTKKYQIDLTVPENKAQGAKGESE